MSSVTVEHAQAHLPELIEKLQQGDEITITSGQLPVARLLAHEHRRRKPRRPGNCAGMMTIVTEDEEHLRDFAEYMG